MAKNEVYRNADHIDLPVPAETKSGDPVFVGSLPGVAVTDRQSDGTATVWRTGAFLLEVGDAVANVGDPVHLPQGSKVLTAAAVAGRVFGYALQTKTAMSAKIAIAIAKV